MFLPGHPLQNGFACASQGVTTRRLSRHFRRPTLSHLPKSSFQCHLVGWKVPRRGRRPHTSPAFPLGQRWDNTVTPALRPPPPNQCGTFSPGVLLATLRIPPSPRPTLSLLFDVTHSRRLVYISTAFFFSFFLPPSIFTGPERAVLSCLSDSTQAVSAVQLTSQQ